MTSFWHPFADMAAVAGRSLVMERGEGVYVYDNAGRRYLDGTAALWFCNVGYGRAEIAEAARLQLERLHTFHAFGDYTNPAAEALTTRIAGLAPAVGSKVFLASGGSDAVDTAVKLARRYFQLTGEPHRTVFIVRGFAYHGTHAGGTSLAGIGANRQGYGPLLEDVVTVEWDSVTDLRRTIGRVGPERVAAMFVEPVIGAGGVRIAPEGYLKEARAAVADAGALFVADEVITAFGRLGSWFASDRFSLEPDLITFAKGVTSGYLPLGGVVARPRVAEPFWLGGETWRHGYTYSGHAAVCAAAMANLDILAGEGLLARALELEVELEAALVPMAAHPLVEEIRAGTGVMAAVQLDEKALAAEPGLAGRAVLAARQAGVITRALTGGGLQVSPPLIISREQLLELAGGLHTALDRL